HYPARRQDHRHAQRQGARNRQSSGAAVTARDILEALSTPVQGTGAWSSSGQRSRLNPFSSPPGKPPENTTALNSFRHCNNSRPKQDFLAWVATKCALPDVNFL